jgi:hypothetical protein
MLKEDRPLLGAVLVADVVVAVEIPSQPTQLTPSRQDFSMRCAKFGQEPHPPIANGYGGNFFYAQAVGSLTVDGTLRPRLVERIGRAADGGAGEHVLHLGDELLEAKGLGQEVQVFLEIRGTK